jgi:hypothetical protein
MDRLGVLWLHKIEYLIEPRYERMHVSRGRFVCPTRFESVDYHVTTCRVVVQPVSPFAIGTIRQMTAGQTK